MAVALIRCLNVYSIMMLSKCLGCQLQGAEAAAAPGAAAGGEYCDRERERETALAGSRLTRRRVLAVAGAARRDGGPARRTRRGAPPRRLSRLLALSPSVISVLLSVSG